VKRKAATKRPGKEAAREAVRTTDWAEHAPGRDDTHAVEAAPALPPKAPPDPPPPDRKTRLVDLASRLLDMVERVEWVRASAGSHYVCPFCHAVDERSGGAFHVSQKRGHTDDCEWVLVTREGNDLRIEKVLR
jgi:hypothetical protein